VTRRWSIAALAASVAIGAACAAAADDAPKFPGRDWDRFETAQQGGFDAAKLAGREVPQVGAWEYDTTLQRVIAADSG
jgi:hypothetical protein